MVLIRIANQNLGHSLAVANLLNEGLRMGSYDIWTVQEPYLLSKVGRVGGLSGSYIAYHAKERARAAVIIGDTALPTLEIMAERDLVAVLVDLDMSQLLVVSIYLEPQGAVDGQIRTLNGLLNRFREVSIVIQGDFNAKHSIWGNTVEKSDARGDEILEFVIRNDLTIFNVPDCDPTFSSARGELD